MKLQVEKSRTPCVAGDHIFTLVSVELKEFDNKFKNEPSDPDQVTKVLWTFESNRIDPEGQPYEYTAFTGTRYGNSRAALTILMDQMVPGITKAQFEELDTDSLLMSRYRGIIQIRKNEEGKEYPFLAVISPLTEEAAAPAPVPVSPPADAPASPPSSLVIAGIKRKPTLRKLLTAKGWRADDAEALIMSMEDEDPTLEGLEKAIRAGEWDQEGDGTTAATAPPATTEPAGTFTDPFEESDRAEDAALTAGATA